MVALFWGLVLQNLPPLLVKIVSLPLLPRRWLLCAMPPANLRSSIAAKEISVSALLSLSDFQDFVTLFRLVHR
jgi:hypothetical protein